MPKGGVRAGAGRKRGIPNKASIKRQELVAASGITPLDYMLDVVRNEDAPVSRRDDMAKAAAPYVHPRLANIQHTGKDGGAIEISDQSQLEAARRIAYVLQRGMDLLRSQQPKTIEHRAA